MAEELPELTKEQEEFILNNWDKMDLLSLTKACFPDIPNIDGRSKYGKAVKKLMAEKNLTIRTTEFIKAATIVLTDDQKEYIRNNSEMRPMEIAKIIFQRSDIKPLSREFKAVYAYMRECGITTKAEDEPPQDEVYKSPNTLDKIVAKVNRYCSLQLDENKLRPEDKRNMLALLRYVKVYRFGYQINTYLTQVDRELFESSFIRYTYDKEDLLQEDVDQYIDLCSQIVTNAQQDRYIQWLEAEYRTAMEDGNKSKTSYTSVEMINGCKDKLNQGKLRQEKLYNGLVKSRGDRKQGQIAESSSILRLVEAWRMKEKRDELIELNSKQKIVEKKEIERIESLDDVTALIAGVSKEELLYGE